MPGRRLIAPALVITTLALPAGARAAGVASVTLPSTNVAGVTASHTADHGIRIAFSRVRTARAALAKMAGRRVRVTCTEFGTASLSGGNNVQATTYLTLPTRATTLFLNSLTRPYEVCSFAVAHQGRVLVIALNASGREFLANVATTHTLQRVLATSRLLATANGGDAPTVSELQARMRYVVGLRQPSDTPRAGRVGFFSDGRDHIAAVKVSRAGRRLFYDLRGDVVSTNVLRLVARFKILDG